MTLNPVVSFSVISLAISVALLTPTPNTLTDIPIASLADTIRELMGNLARVVRGKLWRD